MFWKLLNMILKGTSPCRRCSEGEDVGVIETFWVVAGGKQTGNFIADSTEGNSLTQQSKNYTRVRCEQKHHPDQYRMCFLQ